jgi:hypothetical protein
MKSEDITKTVPNYKTATGVLNHVFKHNMLQKCIRITLYKTLAKSMLIYGSKA